MFLLTNISEWPREKLKLLHLLSQRVLLARLRLPRQTRSSGKFQLHLVMINWLFAKLYWLILLIVVFILLTAHRLRTISSSRIKLLPWRSLTQIKTTKSVSRPPPRRGQEPRNRQKRKIFCIDSIAVEIFMSLLLYNMIWFIVFWGYHYQSGVSFQSM